MATLMIRSMDERVKSELRILAARRGVSMEQQARDILERAVLGSAPDEPFAQRITKRFGFLAVDALPLPQRQMPRPHVLQPPLQPPLQPTLRPPLQPTLRPKAQRKSGAR